MPEQKVISVIVDYNDQLFDQKSICEREFETVNKYLSQGYLVKQIINVTAGQARAHHEVIIVLEKPDSSF